MKPRGTNHDQSAGIRPPLHHHNLATAYGGNVVGNSSGAPAKLVITSVRPVLLAE